MNEPERFPNLLCLVVGTSSGSDLLRVITEVKADRGYTREAGYNEETMRQAQSRTVLVQLFRVWIDRFQIATAARWKRLLRWTVLTLGVVASFIVFATATDLSLHQPTNATLSQEVIALLRIAGAFLSLIVKAILTGAVAAYMAALFRDITVLVEKARDQR